MRNGVAVFEAVGEGEDFVFRDVNVATQKIENLSRDDMIGKSIVELFPKVKEFGLFSVLQRVWRTGRAELHPVSHYQDKRIVGWRENYVYKLPSGELVSVYEDVTERRQSLEQLERQKARLEEAQRQQNELLRDSQQKYSVLYNNAPLPYQSLDADGCFVDVNPAWLRTLGYQRDEVLGRCFVDFLHPDSRWVFEDSFPELKETGSTHNREYQILHKDGRYLTILLEGCVVYQKDGSFDRTYCVFQDLSERKRLEELVRQEKQRLGSILAAMDIGLIMHDAQYRVQWVNRKIREMFPQGDPVGKLCYDFFEGREAPCERCAVRQSFETGEIQTIESHNQANDRWYYSIAQPMREQDGAFNYVLESVMDITEFKQAEAELQQAYNDKQALLRELQHRAKNSFNVLYNMVYLKSLTSSSENERKTLDDISARIKSMAELYTLLYEAEAVESVPLDRYLAKVAESVVPMAHGCAIKTELEPVTLAARDAVNLGLVVTELVTNALKYAFPETGAGTVRLKLRRTDTGLLLIIADDGVGMSRDFDPSQSRSLGLDLVYKMVAGLQGRLELDSSQGTTWHLYIPLES
jgi:PAS domain S-box-containing protein